MALNRLENFLKNIQGNVIYVNPNDLDSTDSIENQGNSLTRPFKTIQRAALEAARFSYQVGINNDKFDKTTIVVYPGEHLIDNRPGWIPYNDGGNLKFKQRNGTINQTIAEFDTTSNFDLTSSTNELYKLNSIYGGMIIPRGTSIVAMDLRKTKIRPLYVPDPENTNIEKSAIFRITGGSYYWQFSIFDGDPVNNVYRDYNLQRFFPAFSHHKLTAFEYADGVNTININDAFLTHSDSSLTDLDAYYIKVGAVYGPSSGRAIGSDYPNSNRDIQPRVDEYRIVGSTGTSIGISTIKAGDGITPTTTITVITSSAFPSSVDTPVRIDGINDEYNGTFVIASVNSPVEFTYKVLNVPTNPAPSASGGSAKLEIDTVTSASPYIFNISLRSVWGMNGLHADGSKATGFRSVVVAQYTGIGLQKDDKAFVKYNPDTDTYDSYPNIKNLHSDKDAIFKPSYENYHIKASNDAYIQCVSVFAIGFANQFQTETGGDISVTNSNSNFGVKALVANGFKTDAFNQDDVGYITHIIPPKELDQKEVNIEYLSIDISKTVSIANSSRLYLSGYKNQSVTPPSTIDGYRIGAKSGDTLVLPVYILGQPYEYSGSVVMPNSNVSYENVALVGRDNLGISSITSNTIKFKSNHSFVEGESVRVISENGKLPKNLANNQLYYAITNGLNPDQIKLAKTYQDSLGTANTPIEINNLGGELKVVSRVSDKNPGDVGHPVQWDSTNNQWYITVKTDNTIYPALVANAGSLDTSSSRTFFKRKSATRSLEDSIYQFRYVIPKEYTTARPPIDGFIIQESASVDAGTDSTLIYDGTTLSASSVTTQLRNPHFISTASWNTNVVTITTEKPHRLISGSTVLIKNIRSTNNTSGTYNFGYNGSFVVTSTPTNKTFTYTLTTNPGTITNDDDVRGSNFAYFEKNKYANNFYIYRTKEIKPHIPNYQDGIYHLICLNSSNAPTDPNFSNYKFGQNIRNLYPQYDRDNPNSDPGNTTSYSSNKVIGKVEVNDVKLSITKETINKFLLDTRIAIGLSSIQSVGTAQTITFNQEHGLSGITSVTISSGGGSYGSSGSFTGTLYNARLTGGSGSNATANLGVAAGVVTSVTIVDSGSSYNVGDSLSIVGVATTSGFTPATLVVSTINSGVGEVVRVSGITSISYAPFNAYYRISSIVNASSVNVVSETTLPTTTVSNSNVSSANASILGKAVAISTSTFAYNSTTGITTFTTSGTPHGLIPGSKVRIVGSGQTFFNGDFSVTNVVGLNTFSVSAGIGSTLAALSGTVYLYPTIYSSQGGSSDEEISTFPGRCNTIYAGITATLSSAIVSLTSTSIVLTNSLTTGLKKGDYILVDSEIMRIRDNNLSIVSRGLLGTRASTHVSGSIVRKITIIPTEFRRNSIIRASNHAFEYTGYGPGNYSTGLPSEQTKVLSKEEQLLSQAAKIGGGIVVYTGMNANGDFYIGNKKVSSATGQEEVFDSPIPTFTGEDISESGVNIGFDVLSPLEVTVTRSLKVNGGEKNNIISKFDGPVVFNNKITSYAEDGIETTSLLLQGDAKVSVKNTVGISTPTYPGSYGDRVQNANPDSGGYEGWVYTTKNRWEKYGSIGNLDSVPGISSETFVINEDDSNQVRYPIFTNIGAGKTNTIYIDTNSITYTPSTGILTVTGVAATSSLRVGTFTTISGNMIMHTGSVNVSENINISGQIRVRQNQIRFIDSNDNFIAIAGPSTVGTSTTFRLPTSDGTNGQVLQTNGSGQLSWLTISVPTPVPIGGIIMWSGAIGSIPSGWALCNGQTVGSVVTPDLRDRFIVGAGGGYSVGATGGANSVTLTTDQIPSHSHNYLLYQPASFGNELEQSGGPDGARLGGVTNTTNATGGGQAHENRPPYYALAYIMRIS